MRCKYCFYFDETENRSVENYGFMTDDTATALVKKSLEAAKDFLVIGFQGGEPTLIGLPFYKRFIEKVNKYNKRNIRVTFCIQTNGFAINDDWAKFFKENNFLVGLSIDGTKEIHNSYRFSCSGKPSYDKVFHAHELFKQYGVEYNVLTVVTSKIAKNAKEVYRNFISNGLYYHQYIPCIDFISEERGLNDFSLTPALYSEFLINVFKCWYNDFMNNRMVSVRYFDNILSMLLGRMPEACGMSGICSNQYVVEADGAIYPCDFYMLDEYKLGNINTDSYQDLDNKRKELNFIGKSCHIDPECRACKYLQICRGGCRRDRDDFTSETLHKNYFCQSFKDFFDYSLPFFQNILNKIYEEQRRRR